MRGHSQGYDTEVSSASGASGPLEIRPISREEIAKRLREPSPVLLNVLPSAAFTAARIPGSRNLPLAEIEIRARDVLPDPSAEIAVYCGSHT